MKTELRRSMLAALGAVIGIALSAYPTDAGSEAASSSLAAPESFASIADEGQRSAAYFTELGKVLLHPRCLNCHPAGDRPRQGDLARLHQPPVERGADGFGVPGLRCSSCHQAANFGRVPGNPEWHLAPLAMAWEGKSLSEICAQIKDPNRNGGRSLADLVHHIGEDSLVGGLGPPGLADSPLPEPRRRPAPWSRPGRNPEPRVCNPRPRSAT